MQLFILSNARGRHSLFSSTAYSNVILGNGWAIEDNKEGLFKDPLYPAFSDTLYLKSHNQGRLICRVLCYLGTISRENVSSVHEKTQSKVYFSGPPSFLSISNVDNISPHQFLVSLINQSSIVAGTSQRP